MTELLIRYRRVLGHLLPRAMVWAGALAAVVLLLVGPAWLGAVVAMLSTGCLVGWRLGSPRADRHLSARAALAVSLSVAVAAGTGWTPLLGLVLSAVLAALMVESTISHATVPALTARNLPGAQPPPAARVHEPLLIATAASLIALSLGVLGVNAAIVTTLALLALSAALLLAGHQLSRARRHASQREVRKALDGYAPSYCLYYNGTDHGAYQLRMWLPYLARTGAGGVLVIRDDRFLAAAAAITDLPVVLARSVEALEYVAVASVGAFFYVNNDPKNANGVRLGQINHVHLGHGDSDKPASYAATTAMYDQIFVAGRAGVDRFAQHGVLVPSEKFRLVGRPQLEEVQVSDAPVPESPIVLYAPTWRGTLEDSLFGSLHAGERIVSALIDAGATVWFRPHPYSARDAESRVLVSRIDAILAADGGRPHSSSAQTARHTIFECFNASHALVTDISSVASDYLYSNKPLALTDTGVVDDVAAAYPLARAAVLLPVDSDLAGPIAQLLDIDPRKAVRADVRRYYLGDWPADGYAEIFVGAARDAMTQRKTPSVAAG